MTQTPITTSLLAAPRPSTFATAPLYAMPSGAMSWPTTTDLLGFSNTATAMAADVCDAHLGSTDGNHGVEDSKRVNPGFLKGGLT